MAQSVLEMVAFDEEGFMDDANAWTPEIGQAIAAKDSLNQ